MLSFLNPSNAVSYVKELIWGTPIVCQAGDIACELTDGKHQLPSYISNFFAKAEEYTGVSKYISGPVAAGLIGTIFVGYLYKRYQAKDAMDLINNIIKKEFGPVAAEVFEAFKKAVEAAIEKAINDMLSNFSANAKMSTKALEQAKNEVRKSKLEGLLPTLAQTLKEHKASIEKDAKLAKEATPSNKKVLGEKADAPKNCPKAALAQKMGQLLFPAKTKSTLKKTA